MPSAKVEPMAPAPPVASPEDAAGYVPVQTKGTCCGWIKGHLVLKLLKLVMPVGRPKKPFWKLEPPPAPDYSDKKVWWAAYPGLPSSAETTPGGQVAVPQAERKAACFFVHPSGYFGGEYWNEPRGDKASDLLTESFLHTDASAFNGCCRIYAPHYRQASVAAQMFDKKSGIAAFELAYEDVKTAWLHFLKDEPDAPIFIGSHSQGGQHLMRLLAECVEHDKTIQNRLVAVYMIGTNMLTRDVFVRSFPSLHPSNGPTDTPCAVVAYDSKGAGTAAAKPMDPDMLREFPGFWYPTGWEVPPKGEPTLNTNPLTWTSEIGTRASAGWLGAACVRMPESTTAFTQKEFFTGKLTDAQAKPPLEAEGYQPAGVEFVAEVLPHCLAVTHLRAEDRGVFGKFTGSGDYHVLDWALFYYNIRQNISDRLEAYQKIAG